MKDSIKDKAIYWAACEKEGLSEQQQSELNVWLKKSSENQNAFNEAKNVYTFFQSIPKAHSQRLSQKAHQGAKKTKFVEKRLKPFIACSMLIITLFMGYEFVLPDFRKSYHTQYLTLKKEILPDGSSIAIDAKSKIKIKYVNNKREVVLYSGQAMFNVKKDAQRPFVITSGQTAIEVVGTRFEVSNIEDTTTVSVLNGKVKVGYMATLFQEPRNISFLTQGQKMAVSNSGQVTYLGKTNLDEIASWVNDELIFRKITLQNAFKHFARYQDIEVIFENKEAGNKLFSGKFHTNDIDTFIFAIQKIYPIQIIKENKRIVIR